jgi:hypothetical protein
VIRVDGEGISRRNEWSDGARAILGISRNEAREDRLVLCGANDIAALQGTPGCPSLRRCIKENLALRVREHNGANVTTGKHRSTANGNVSLYRTKGVSDSPNRSDRRHIKFNVCGFKLRICKGDTTNHHGEARTAPLRISGAG